MKRFSMLFFCVLLIPTFACADMPGSRFMKRAFQPNIIDKWRKAVGVMMLQDADGWPERYKIYERPDDTSGVIREFTIKNRKPVNLPMEEYMKQSKSYIDQLPLFVSAHGYGDEVPGYAIFIPMLDIRDKWALIYVDWNAGLKGWIKLAKNYYLFDKSVDNIWHFNIKTFYYPKKKTVLRPVEPNKKSIFIDDSTVKSKSIQIYKNDHYIYVPGVTRTGKNRIFTTRDGSNYVIENNNDVYIFKWIYWPVGD